MGNSVLIFGSDSFTGQYLSPLLKEHGYEVTGTNFKKKEDPGFCDITDYPMVLNLLRRLKPDYIINLSGISFVPTKDTSAIYNVNLLGTINICSAIQELGLESKTIMASTGQVYSDNGQVPINETSEILPSNHYSISKWTAELTASQVFQELDVIFTRPFNYTGVGQDNKFLIPKIISHFKMKKDEIELGNIEVYRDFTDVRDVVLAYFSILESNVTGPMNICCGQMYSIQQILDLCSEITGFSPRIKVNPEFVRANERKHIIGDNSKLMKTGWGPTYSMKSTLEWMLSSEETIFQ